ncbi:MAG: hypothetical protein QOH93_896 [Chloroflexia bacterium]|nr:hypothetical protein [Chloroflexia bacterium]
MIDIPVSMITGSIITLLTEAYPGPPNHNSTWFIDNEPDAGILGLLRDVTAEEASRSVDGTANPGTTIASHTEHLHWSLANMNRAMSGGEFGKWSESWDLKQANAAEWDRLRSELQKEFEILCTGLRNQTELDPRYLTGGLALAAHAAYHLGNIRQMKERVRE